MARAADHSCWQYCRVARNWGTAASATIRSARTEPALEKIFDGLPVRRQRKAERRFAKARRDGDLEFAVADGGDFARAPSQHRARQDVAPMMLFRFDARITDERRNGVGRKPVTPAISDLQIACRRERYGRRIRGERMPVGFVGPSFF